MSRYSVYILRTEESDVKYVGVTSGKDRVFLFDSASDAADYFGLKRCKIVMVCNGVRNKTGGIVFRYKEKNIKF